MKKSISTHVVLIAFTMLLVIGQVESQNLQTANELAAKGRYQEAEQIYNTLLSQDPGNTAVMLSSAYNHSWMGARAAAEREFNMVLAKEPRNVQAMSGRAYNLAWGGQYEAAARQFEELAQVDPGNLEAEKGIAYVQLWRGDSRAAVENFESLVNRYPRDENYRVALAQAYIQLHQAKKAREVLQPALQQSPENELVREVWLGAFQQAARFEIDALPGYSIVDGENRFGIRLLGISGQVSKRLRLGLRYDNTLGMDVAAVIRQNQNAQTVMGSAVYNWKKNATSRIELGARLLPNKATQQVVAAEQVVFMPGNWHFKLGGFVALSPKTSNEWMTYTAVHVPIGSYFAIEPHYFLSKVVDAPAVEHRLMLNNKFRTADGYELNLGFMYGKAPGNENISNGQIYGGLLTALLPFGQRVWGLAALRYEKGVIENLTSLAIGAKIRFE